LRADNYYVSQFIYLKLIFQVAHHAFAAVTMTE